MGLARFAQRGASAAVSSASIIVTSMVARLWFFSRLISVTTEPVGVET